MTGDAAVRGIRELDAEGSIGMIGLEPDPPYARPALSKGLWKGRPMEKVWRGTEKHKVDLHTGREVMEIDTERKRVKDDQYTEYEYERLLYATGGTPRHLPFGGSDIIYYRTLQDYHYLRSLADVHERFLVIGGSFIGSELAAALSMAGRKVTMVFPEPGICAAIFPRELSDYLNGYYREKGVEVLTGETIEGLERPEELILARTAGGRQIEADGAVAGIGIRPNIELAKRAGLQVDDGVVVDEQLRTSAPDVFAAGDAAWFQHAALGRPVRVEHEDNALKMGKQAGRNMAGAGEPYTHTPMFYSDLFDLGYEAVGDLSSKMDTVVDWQEPYRKGVIYYLDGGRVRGVLLWNVWEKVDAARALLTEPGPFKEADLRGKITG
jgi:NADPH-dependent 2,4-dienoyl-CoA reductase/sulfur reductase-like enzyme